MSEKTITIYTDGACSGNPGPGGWAAIIIYNGIEKMVCGGEEFTTNNRMELLAAIKALEALKRSCKIDLYTDSTYVRSGVLEWMSGWKKKGWKNSKNQEVKNLDLWQELDELQALHTIDWHWVKGHSGDKYNDKVDYLAVKMRDKFKN